MMMQNEYLARRILNLK